MNLLGRYYTNDVISSLLVNNMDTINAERILDLGIGNASLTKAAYGRWERAIFYATEIESEKVKEIRKDLSFVRISNYDSLKSNVKTTLKIKLGTIDVAICNPPYVKVEMKRSYKRLFAEAGIEECVKLKKLSSEIVFFAHNLSLLRPDGELGIIVSDSLITCKEFELFRETILQKCNLKTIIQLPDKIFPKTEARTHILVLNKSEPRNEKCTIYLANSEGKYEGNLSVEKSLLKERMDFQFWNFASRKKQIKTKLKDLEVQINRGNFSYKELRESQHPFFHTTHFNEKKKALEFTEQVSEKHLGHAAKEGDILLSRVGKRCIGKISRIEKGSIIISDCVYRIRVPKQYQTAVWLSFISEDGQDWIKAYAHGVCSQVISKCDLENFPVVFNECEIS